MEFDCEQEGTKVIDTLLETGGEGVVTVIGELIGAEVVNPFEFGNEVIELDTGGETRAARQT